MVKSPVLRLAIILFFILTSGAGLFADTDITIYYTASLNGNMIGCDCKGVPKAGLSTTASYMRGINKDDSLLIDLGDFNDARTDELLADTLVELYGDLGYDFLSLGDQELASGIQYFSKISSRLNFICNNIKINDRQLTPEPVIIEKKGIRIGIAAVINPDVFFFYPDEIKDRISIDDPVAAAESALKKLEEEGCNFRLLLVHGSLESAKKLYEDQQGWDAVLAAHDQILFEQADGKRVIASPGEEGNRIGILNLSFRFSRLTESSNTFRYFKYEVDPEDPDVLQAFEDYKKELINNLKNGKN